MNRPEYWDSDETWATYEAWRALQPRQQPEPMAGLQKAIARARGDLLTEGDMKEAIGFGNLFWEAYKAGQFLEEKSG